ncbi:hydrolase-like protein [Natrinema pellirubrum DSM 15624]|uniref:Palmitoyl-protein thioesterase ABHD10, mitochondrial n=1 Tax=Natrinema pellirubrum (strain DSM 15624 / CIP 106293 / JCM 10476 / NCIMB 786 / 157) TaxID=797303 RepID=L9Z9E5_NATP1|nr:alpha/beta hydrolase [Natrinema pellirubrum]ELY81798.1 hydrolase-like protein [Natrinema pellirubrum DSM 15624]
MPESHRIPIETAAATGSAPEVAAVHHETDSDDWIVFCHGLRSDKSGSYEGRCRRAVREGYNAVRFDCRGCGESDGTFVDATLEARLADLRAVTEYFDPDSYVLFGSSFGGKMAFHAAATDDRVRAVATRAPVTTTDTFDEYRSTIDRDGGGYSSRPANGSTVGSSRRWIATPSTMSSNRSRSRSRSSTAVPTTSSIPPTVSRPLGDSRPTSSSSGSPAKAIASRGWPRTDCGSDCSTGSSGPAARAGGADPLCSG